MHGSVLGFFAYGALQTAEVAGRRVLEVGSLDVNGSVRFMVEHRVPAEYIGVDIMPGPGVDQVADAVDLVDRFGSDSFDVVLCLEMLEHAEDWRATLWSMIRVLRPGGVLVITTRSPGFAYHHPPDHWRYTQGAFVEIIERTGLDTLVLMDDPEYPGVFVKVRKPLDWKPIPDDLLDVGGITSVIEPLKMLGLPMQPDGTGYYRYWQPWSELAKSSGHLAMIPPGRPHPLIPADDEIEAFDLVSRQRPGGRETLREWRRWKPLTKLIFETDDDILHPDTSLSHFASDEIHDSVIECLRLADAVTCSTEPLAEELREYNDRVFIVPNFIHADALTINPSNQEKLTLCWAGGSTHLQDMAMIQEPVNKVLAGHDADVELHFIGMDYSCLFRCPTRFTPWQVNQWDYYRAIDGDIGLIPLLSTQFNRSRTYIKALEFAALGIPVIASDSDPYREFVIDGVTGLLARTDRDWIDAIYTLGRDQELRSVMGAAAREHARRYTIQGNWQRWAEALASVAGETGE